MNITKAVLYYVLFAVIFIVVYGLCVEKRMAQWSTDSDGYNSGSSVRIMKIRF